MYKFRVEIKIQKGFILLEKDVDDKAISHGADHPQDKEDQSKEMLQTEQRHIQEQVFVGKQDPCCHLHDWVSWWELSPVRVGDGQDILRGAVSVPHA